MSASKERIAVTRELMKRLGEFREALPIRRHDGSIPVVVAFGTDCVSEVVQKVAASGGEANVIVIPPGHTAGGRFDRMAILSVEAARVMAPARDETADPAEVHEDIRIDFLLDTLLKHEGRTTIALRDRGPSASVPSPAKVLELA